MGQGRVLKNNGAAGEPGAKGASGFHQFWLSYLFALAPLILVAYLIGLYVWVERENGFAAMQARNYIYCRLAEAQPLMHAIRPLLIGLAAVRLRAQAEQHSAASPPAASSSAGCAPVDPDPDLELGAILPVLAEGPAPPIP